MYPTVIDYGASNKLLALDALKANYQR